MAFVKVLSQLLCYAAKVVSPPCLRSSMSLACHLIWEEEKPCLRAQFIPRGRWHGWEGSCSLSYPFPSSSQSHLLSHPHTHAIRLLSPSLSPSLPPPPTAAGCAPNPRSTGGNAGSFGAGTVARATTEQPIQPIAADRASRHCRKEIFLLPGSAVPLTADAGQSQRCPTHGLIAASTPKNKGATGAAAPRAAGQEEQHKSHRNASFYRA